MRACVRACVRAWVCGYVGGYTWMCACAICVHIVFMVEKQLISAKV